MINEIIFLRKYIFWFLLACPVLIIYFFLIKNFKNNIYRFYFLNVKRIGMNVKMSIRREFLSMVLTIISFSFLIFALSGPQFGKKEIEIEQKGIDIVIALDVSKSMDAEDIKPSRISRAKLELIEFIRMLKGDRVALITFAGKTIQNSPLTSDYLALEMFIQEIDTNMIQYQGTDLNGAVMKSLDSFSDKNAKGRAIILISDGENHDQSLSQALNEAKKKQVKIYSIGAGTTQGAPIPENGRGFKRNNNGEVILTKLDASELKILSQDSGGQYFASSNQGYQLGQVYNLINRDISQVLFGQNKESDLIDRYQIPLVVGLLCIILEYLVVRRGGVILFILFGLYSNPLQANLFLNNFSNSYKNSNFEESEKLVKTEALKNLDPKLLYNLGASLYKQNKLDEAKEVFTLVKKGENNNFKIKGGFGLGNTYFQKNDFQSAINEYEDVLKIDPNDEDAKKNLELAKKMLNQKDQQQNKSDENENSDQDKKNEKDKSDQSQNSDKNQQEEKSDQEAEKKENQENNQENNQEKNQEQNSSQSEKSKEDQENKDNKMGEKSNEDDKENPEDKKEDKNQLASNKEEEKNKDDEKNDSKTSYRSRMLLNQIEDSRKNYQQQKENKEPNFNRSGQNDW